MMLQSIVLFHILWGAIALFAGYAVIICNKGQTSHKYLGRTYVIAMLFLGLSGSYIAIIQKVPLSFLNGLVLCYFVLSALNTIWQPAKTINKIDKQLFTFVCLLLIGFVWYAYQAAIAPSGKLGGFGVPAYVVFGSVILGCAIADFRYIRMGGKHGKSRLIRHLWRMFFPLFMSTAAFFFGQAKHLPMALQRIEFLIVPVLFVILTAIYWVAKTQFNFKVLGSQ